MSEKNKQHHKHFISLQEWYWLEEGLPGEMSKIHQFLFSSSASCACKVKQMSDVELLIFSLFLQHSS